MYLDLFTSWRGISPAIREMVARSVIPEKQRWFDSTTGDNQLANWGRINVRCLGHDILDVLFPTSLVKVGWFFKKLKNKRYEPI